MNGSGVAIFVTNFRFTFALKVPFRPLVVVTPADFSTSVTSAAESAAIVHYTSGFVHSVDCYNDRSGRNRDGRLSISSVQYAHRFVKFASRRNGVSLLITTKLSIISTDRSRACWCKKFSSRTRPETASFSASNGSESIAGTERRP